MRCFRKGAAAILVTKLVLQLRGEAIIAVIKNNKKNMYIKYFLCIYRELLVLSERINVKYLKNKSILPVVMAINIIISYRQNDIVDRFQSLFMFKGL